MHWDAAIGLGLTVAGLTSMMRGCQCGVVGVNTSARLIWSHLSYVLEAEGGVTQPRSGVRVEYSWSTAMAGNTTPDISRSRILVSLGRDGRICADARFWTNDRVGFGFE